MVAVDSCSLFCSEGEGRSTRRGESEEGKKRRREGAMYLGFELCTCRLSHTAHFAQFSFTSALPALINFPGCFQVKSRRFATPSQAQMREQGMLQLRGDARTKD